MGLSRKGLWRVLLLDVWIPVTYVGDRPDFWDCCSSRNSVSLDRRGQTWGEMRDGDRASEIYSRMWAERDHRPQTDAALHGKGKRTSWAELQVQGPGPKRCLLSVMGTPILSEPPWEQTSVVLSYQLCSNVWQPRKQIHSHFLRFAGIV